LVPSRSPFPAFLSRL